MASDLCVHRGMCGALVCLGALLTGCGVSDYNQLIERRATQLRTGAPYKLLFAPTAVPDTPFSIRVPMAFKHSYLEASAHPQDGNRINRERLQPPFLAIPGLKLCYEGSATAQPGLLPFYCYLAAVPVKKGELAKLETDLLAQLKAKIPETPDAWEMVDAKGPDGRQTAWKKIRINSDQPFIYLDPFNANQRTSKPFPAIFELWIHDADQYAVLVGWRTPADLDSRSGGAPAGSQKKKSDKGGADEELRPDMELMPGLTAGTLTIDATPPGGPA